VKNKALFIVGAFLLFSSGLFSQTQTIHHQAGFETSSLQSMWGANGVNFNIDQTITLFNQSWNEGFDTGSSGIVSLAGFDFGGGLAGNFSGVIGSEISLKGFTLGQISAEYPVDIDVTMSQNETYDQGDSVSVNTSYEVEDDYSLETFYPSAGELSWDFYFRMAAGVQAQICAFSCATFPIIPQFDTGLQTINLVHVSGNGATTGPNNGPDGPLGVWYLGLADIAGPDEDGIRGWPYAKPPAGSANSLPSDDQPWQVHIPAGVDGSVLAELPENSFGLTGELTIPYVITDDQLDPTTGNISATGDSTYFNLNLEIFKVLGKVLQLIPSPQTQAAGTALGYLSGSQELGIAELTWNFFSASIDANITNTQEFDFTPKIYGKYEFPIPVGYSIFNTSDVLISSGTSSIINLEIGNSFRYKFPCYYDSLNITPTYTIDGIIRNHTYDEVSFDFLMSAFEFGFEIPAITVIPGFTIPEICIPIPYPCPTWTKPWKWCTYSACTPEIVVPPIGFPGWELSVGPLFNFEEPIGSFSYDWFDDAWSLGGFSPISFAPFSMVANRLDISTSFTDITCNGDNTGAIDVFTQAISPAFPYDFLWSNGASSQLNTENTSLTGLTEGSYQVTVYDANQCQMFQGATISEPEELVVNYLSEDITCNGADDGVIDIVAVGGTGNYTYTLNNQSVGSSITNLPPGQYSITVSDFLSCTKSINVIISEPSELTQSSSISNVNCKGGNDGEINTNVVGGTLPYIYSWDTQSSSNSEDQTGLIADTYTLSVVDGNGCENVKSYIVEEPQTLISVSVNSNFTNVSCFGDSTGSIDITTDGGTPGYTYLWSSEVGGVLPYSSEDLSMIPVGSYTLIATDLKGCQDIINQVISGPSLPLNTSPSYTNILCNGESTGEINPNIFGGTSGYSYIWSNSSNQEIASGLIAGDYSLTVTDTNSCVKEFNYQLTEPLSSLSMSSSKTDVKCYGDSTGEVFLDVMGGAGGYSYLWSNGSDSKDISNLFEGSYSVVVTDSNNCSISDNIVIDQPLAPLTLSSSVTNVGCYGEATGGIDLVINGGTTPYFKQWSNSSSFILSDTTSELSNQLSDTFLVVVTDIKGCTEELTSAISQPTAPISISGLSNFVNCNGLSDGSIDIDVSGGAQEYSYVWSNGSTDEDLTDLSAGTYLITVTDTSNCIETNSFVVTEPSSALSVSLSKMDVMCSGGLDGQIESMVQGGTQPYTYLWSNNENSENLIGISAGVYTLNVTDENGCSAFTGTQVLEPDLLVVNSVVTGPSCSGYDDGNVVLSISGGIQPYVFNWGNEDEILLNNSSETLDSLISSDYFIRVRDDNGCINEQIIIVSEPDPLLISASVTDVTCFDGVDGAITLDISGGTAPYPIVWSGGQTSQQIGNLLEGTYTYSVVDSQGCPYIDSSYVSQPEIIKISYEIKPISCIDQTDAGIYVSPYGGTVPYNYIWSNGSSNQNIESLSSGQYQLTVSDFYGCNQMFDFEIQLNNDECLNIPNTFTPNNDNYNDTWIVGNIDLYPQAIVKVFNKWGNQVFSSDGSYSPWDGTHRGVSLPSDVYYYIIVLSNQEENEYTGTVTIIR